MHFGGRIRADAPDPQEELRARARKFGIPVAGLVPQRHLQDLGITGMQLAERHTDGGVLTESATFSRNYTVWKNPDDHDDPVNLRPLDDALLRIEASAIPDDLPAWLIQRREQLRYPTLWEAVQTHWAAGVGNGAEVLDVASLLTDHVDYVLHNTYRVEYGLGDRIDEPWEPLVRRAAVQRSGVTVDSAVVEAGAMIDTDPFVIGLGAPLPDGRALTAVVARDLLDFVSLEFVSEGPDLQAGAAGRTAV